MLLEEKFGKRIFEYVAMGGRSYRTRTNYKSGEIGFLVMSKLNKWVDSARDNWTYPTRPAKLERANILHCSNSAGFAAYVCFTLVAQDARGMQWKWKIHCSKK